MIRICVLTAFIFAFSVLRSWAQPLLIQLDRHHSSVNFEAAYLGLMKQKGTFDRFDFALQYDALQPVPLLSLTATIDMRSIDTNNQVRDNHLKSPDFLAAAKYPFAVFQSTEIEKVTDTEYRVTGTLDLKGVVKRISVIVRELYPLTEDRGKNLRIGFSGTFTMNRKDFGILGGNDHNKRFNLKEQIVGEEVFLEFNIQGIRQIATDWQPTLDLTSEYQERGFDVFLEQKKGLLETLQRDTGDLSQDQLSEMIALIEMGNLLLYQGSYAEVLELLGGFKDFGHPIMRKAAVVLLETLFRLKKREELKATANQVLRQIPGNATALELLRF